MCHAPVIVPAMIVATTLRTRKALNHTLVVALPGQQQTPCRIMVRSPRPQQGWASFSYGTEGVLCQLRPAGAAAPAPTLRGPDPPARSLLPGPKLRASPQPLA